MYERNGDKETFKWFICTLTLTGAGPLILFTAWTIFFLLNTVVTPILVCVALEVIFGVTYSLSFNSICAMMFLSVLLMKKQFMKKQFMIKQYRIKGDFVWKDCKDDAQYGRMKLASHAEVREVSIEVAYADLKKAYATLTGAQNVNVSQM